MNIIKSLFITLVTASLLYSCGTSDEDTIIPDQREAITQFLDNNELEYEEVNSVFRHFPSPRTSNPDAPVVKQGDEVGIYFELYNATYTKQNGSLAPVPTTALYSNKKFIQDTLRKLNLNTEYWPSCEEPLNAKVGSGELITGLNRGLVGCRKGDSVLLFITSNLAFGEKPTSIIPANTAILYIVNIQTVNNQ